tara:strand:- start:40088 stop:40252 length:165 start_codon:yes stop_codon:yes gene_type:complete
MSIKKCIKEFEIKGIPFIIGCLIVGYISGQNYDFALSASLIFGLLALTKQVKLI